MLLGASLRGFVSSRSEVLFKSTVALYLCFNCLGEVLFNSENTAPNQIPNPLETRFPTHLKPDDTVKEVEILLH